MKSPAYIRPIGIALLAGSLAAFSLSAPVIAQEQERDRSHETCDTYDMDVAADMELLGKEATALAMAADAAGEVPSFELGQTYEITLHPQGEVNFTVEPSRVMLAEGSYAGFLTITVPEPGRYRFSFSGESWVDMVGEGKTLDTVLFAGRHACQPLRKLVDYNLEPGKTYMLMLSGRTKANMLLASRRVEE